MLIQDVVSIPCMLSMAQKLALGLAASFLGPESVIVEVGSFHGGSARILHDSSCASVFSIDIDDYLDADLVSGCPRLQFFLGGTQRFAREHAQREIDLLFIDGDHSLFGVKNDFYTLLPQLAKGATVAFHDYTSEYFGVQLFCNSLESAGILAGCVNIEGMFLGEYTGRARCLEEQDYGRALSAMVEVIGPLPTASDVSAALEDASLVLALQGIEGQGTCIGQGSMGELFADYFSLDFGSFINSSEAPRADGCYYVCSHAFDDIAGYLRNELGVDPGRIFKGDAVLSFAMLSDLLLRSGQRICEMTEDRDVRLVAGILANAGQEFVTHLYFHNRHSLIDIFKVVRIE